MPKSKVVSLPCPKGEGIPHSAIVCLDCGDVIFSRARHDYRSCTCGSSAIDGGFDYVKVSGTERSVLFPIVLPARLTKDKLYRDWNFSLDKEGKYKVGCWPNYIQKGITANPKLTTVAEMTFPKKEPQ